MKNFEIGSEIIVDQTIDGIPTQSIVAATYIADSMVTFESPILQEGIADVTIRGPSGLQDTRMGALIVMHNAHAEIDAVNSDTGLSNDTGSVDGINKGSSASCNSTSRNDILLPFLLPLLLLRIRRRE